MDNAVYAFLNKPKWLLAEIRKTEAEIEGLRLSMYPSGIRYDVEKVVSSPVDPMPRYAVRMDELQDQLRALRVAHMEAQDAICTATKNMTQFEQEVIMLRYVALWSWSRINMDTGKGRATVFRAHKSAQKKVKKYLDDTK